MVYPGFFSRLSKAVFAAFLLTLASPLTSSAAQLENLNTALKITVDRAKVVRIAKSADTVIVGNPAIVDATIQDSRTIVLTGRTFGVTNLIVLDSNGDPIVDETVVVKGHEVNTVRIFRRSIRETLACSPVCEPTLTIGDDPGSFEVYNKQIKDRSERTTDALAN